MPAPEGNQFAGKELPQPTTTQTQTKNTMNETPKRGRPGKPHVGKYCLKIPRQAMTDLDVLREPVKLTRGEQIADLARNERARRERGQHERAYTLRSTNATLDGTQVEIRGETLAEIDRKRAEIEANPVVTGLIPEPTKTP